MQIYMPSLKCTHSHPLTETLATLNNITTLKLKGFGRPGAQMNCLYKTQRKYSIQSGDLTQPIMLHTSLGFPCNLTIHLSFTLPLHPSSVWFRHLIVSLPCVVLLVMLQYAMYVQYFWVCRKPLCVSIFSHCLAQLSLNQDMLWAADDDGDSVMWECHQSLGTVTGFCLSASDAQTVAFSVHFTIAAVSFVLFLLGFFPFQVYFMQVKYWGNLVNFGLCRHMHHHWSASKSDCSPKFSQATCKSCNTSVQWVLVMHLKLFG